jgi:hypothetical protein
MRKCVVDPIAWLRSDHGGWQIVNGYGGDTRVVMKVKGCLAPEPAAMKARNESTTSSAGGGEDVNVSSHNLYLDHGVMKVLG